MVPIISETAYLGTFIRPIRHLVDNWAWFDECETTFAIEVSIAMLHAQGKELLTSHSTEENEVRAAGDNSTSNMTRIERGTFEMPIRFPQVQSSACLARMNESVAWQCASDTTFQLDLIRTPIGDNSNATFISIGVESINKSIYHGHQVPNIASVPLSPSSSAESGPYYHFRTSYDRVVVLREDDLTAAERPRPQPSTRHPIFNPGDSLWRCIFNDTTIEGYLYINQTSTPEVETTINSTAPDLPKVPYVVKLLEEDMPTAKSHYCEKGTIERDGRFLVKGGKISLSLTDTVRASETRRARGFRWARLRKKQQSEGQNYCRCQWMVQ